MPSAIDHYESFLVNNVSTISTVESTLRSITWVLPGRFKDAELAAKYSAPGKKIPIQVAHDAYFDGKLELKGVCVCAPLLTRVPLPTSPLLTHVAQ